MAGDDVQAGRGDPVDVGTSVAASSGAALAGDAYPAAVEAALNSCLAPEDPLDGKNFDPIAFVNSRFPDEKAFAGLDPYVAQLGAQITQLDGEIFEAVKTQSAQANKATAEIQEAKASIVQLQTKVRDINRKAAQSEVMVQEICRDIKKLDFAKRHITHTITSLKRFHMLVTAVDQLDFLIENRQYRDTANLLDAIDQLFIHFESHGSVNSVAELRDSVTATKTQLSAQILKDFNSLSDVSADYASMSKATEEAQKPQSITQASQESSTTSSLFQVDSGLPQHSYDEHVEETSSALTSSASMFYSSDSHTPESLAGACAVADALGPAFRHRLIEQICTMWLDPYEKLFGPGQEHCGLESAERRYAWLRRLLRSNEERYGDIFPDCWCIDKHAMVAFSQKTEEHLKSVLRTIDPPDSAEVSSLIRALRKTLDFEHEMSIKFEQDRKSAESPLDDALFDENGDQVDPMSAKGIKLKHELANRKTKAELETAASNDLADGLAESRAAALAEAANLDSVSGMISGVFEPYLTAYVKLEARTMQEELNQVIAEELQAEGSPLHMESASKMFLLIQKSIGRCTEFTSGQAFYSLCREFEKVMAGYSAMLGQRLPETLTPLSAKLAATACFVCNSAEYCFDTVGQLEDFIKGKIKEAYRDAIDFDDSVTLFSSNLQRSLKAIESAVEASILPDLNLLTKTNWSTFGQVGDNSNFVATLTTILNEYIPYIRERLTSEHNFRKLCQQIASALIKRFRSTLSKCKNVGDTGAQQLLLDAHAVKSILLRLPTLEKSGTSSADQTDAFSTVYRKYVNGEMQRLSVVLKLVGMGLEPQQLVENFKALLADGTLQDVHLVLRLASVSSENSSKTLALAKQAGIPEGEKSSIRAVRTTGANASSTKPSPSKGNNSSASATASLNTVFSKMNDMKEHLDKVTAGTPGAKGFSQLSATFQQSYQRAVKKNSSEK